MTDSRLTGPLRLAACVGIVAVAWLVVLPWVGRHPPIQRHVRAMEEAEVNPAAMVYTELERLPLKPGWVEDQLVLWPDPVWASSSRSVGTPPAGSGQR